MITFYIFFPQPGQRLRFIYVCVSHDVFVLALLLFFYYFLPLLSSSRMTAMMAPFNNNGVSILYLSFFAFLLSQFFIVYFHRHLLLLTLLLAMNPQVQTACRFIPPAENKRITQDKTTPLQSFNHPAGNLPQLWQSIIHVGLFFFGMCSASAWVLGSQLAVLME